MMMAVAVIVVDLVAAETGRVPIVMMMSVMMAARIIMGVTAMRMTVRFEVGGAARRVGPQSTERAKKAITLDHNGPGAEEHDQAITNDFDNLDRIAHELGSGAEEHGADSDDQYGGQRLHYRRCERQGDAATPSLVIGKEIGRNHRLAVAGSGRMEDAVKERNP